MPSVLPDGRCPHTSYCLSTTSRRRPSWTGSRSRSGTGKEIWVFLLIKPIQFYFMFFFSFELTGCNSDYHFHRISYPFLHQVISDLRELLDLQFDLANTSNNNSGEISPMNLMKRMSNLRQLRDPQTMNRLAQMARQRPPPPPPFVLPPGRFNHYRYPPTPSTFMGAPPPPQNLQPQQQERPGLFLGGEGHLHTPRHNERESTDYVFFLALHLNVL